MKNKKFLLILIFAIIIICIGSFFIFFKKNTAKNFKIGNNTTSQEIVDYILNINSYETQIEVEITTNKNQTKYKMKQIYNEEENSQEILEPSNIAGVKIKKQGNTLTLENTDLNLTSIFENYNYISDNSLDLSTFLENYKKYDNSNWEENEGQIIMKTTTDEKEENVLYISKETGLPLKLEIKDTNKKTAVYILYKEVSVNS